MPRRSPGEIRSQLPARVLRYRLAAIRRQPPVIRGLSPSANRQIAAFERAHGISPGTVANAFMRWASAGRRPCQDPPPDYHHYDPNMPSGYDHVRGLLEGTTWALHPRARRELRTQLKPLDDRIIARTVNDPFAPQFLPWWRRRIEI
jgi:hypothetical protein